MKPARKLTEEQAGLSPSDIREHYAEFTEMLNQRREEILGRNSEARANLDEQLLTAPGDDADISVLDTSADYFLKLANTHQHELMEIRDAFDRMHRGVYGICQQCENPIGKERLEKLPYARMCIDCQSTFEARRFSRRLQTIPKM